jgi:cobalt-zinc-cadmium efflux system outer membrane protein
MWKLNLLFSVLLFPLEIGAQTGIAVNLPITFSEAKNRLLKENLEILAAHLEIDGAEASVKQAKLWNNPYFIWNQDMYSANRNQYFNFRLQTLVQVEQVFSISGKHTNSVKLARLNAELTQHQFDDVVRALIFELSNHYVNLLAGRNKEQLYEDMLKNYDRLLQSSEKQYELGLLSYNELVRLKSERMLINAELIEIQNINAEENTQMNTMLNYPSDFRLEPSDLSINTQDSLTFDQLLIAAKEFRPDIKLSSKNITYNERDLKLQQSMSVPDLKLGYQPFDRGSNYVRPYSGLVFEMPLPVFNRNQGSIQAARVRLEQANIQNQLDMLSLENEVMSAFLQLGNNRKGLVQYATQFMRNLEELKNEADKNYLQKNISLLEYIDYQRIYVTTQMQYIALKQSYLLKVNQMNFVIGKEITN